MQYKGSTCWCYLTINWHQILFVIFNVHLWLVLLLEYTNLSWWKHPAEPIPVIDESWTILEFSAKGIWQNTRQKNLNMCDKPTFFLCPCCMCISMVFRTKQHNKSAAGPLSLSLSNLFMWHLKVIYPGQQLVEWQMTWHYRIHILNFRFKLLCQLLAYNEYY